MPDVTSTLQTILSSHGIDTRFEKNGWLTSNGSYPVCCAYTQEPQSHNNGCMVRLDVEVALSPDRILTESFSNLGVDPNQAFRSSLQNFCSGSLHPILSALWGVSDESQVIIEDHKIDHKIWKLHIGNIVRKAADGIDVELPKDFMLIFDRLIKKLQLSPSIHWGRLFYANMPNTNNIVEVLLDNQNWVEAESEFNRALWQKLNSFYSHRMFWIMVPQT